MSDNDYIKTIEADNEKLRAKIAQLEEELLPYRKSNEEKIKHTKELMENTKKWMESVQQYPRAGSYADEIAKDLANVQPMSKNIMRDVLKAFKNSTGENK